MRGSGYLFLIVMPFKPVKLMHGHRVLSFSTKKNLTPTGDEEGRMRPVAKESLMYFSTASFTGFERLYSLLVERGAPGNKSMAQSYGRCGGSERARSLLKTS